MGLGGWVFLILFASLGATLLGVEGAFRKKGSNDPGGEPSSSIPRPPLVLEKAPEDMTDRLTPPWQAEFTKKLGEEGYLSLGSYSYSSGDFFWARIFLSPDKRSVFLLVNWLEGRNQAKQVISNVEVYSFDREGSFLLTACAQDGATRLLTGANRPSPRQLSLHLKAVFAESAVRPLLAEHQARMKEREDQGAIYKELTPEDVLPGLSRIFS